MRDEPAMCGLDTVDVTGKSVQLFGKPGVKSCLWGLKHKFMCVFMPLEPCTVGTFRGFCGWGIFPG